MTNQKQKISQPTELFVNQNIEEYFVCSELSLYETQPDPNLWKRTNCVVRRSGICILPLVILVFSSGQYAGLYSEFYDFDVVVVRLVISAPILAMVYLLASSTHRPLRLVRDGVLLALCAGVFVLTYWLCVMFVNQPHCGGFN
jgi:predicted acyltransferase